MAFEEQTLIELFDQQNNGGKLQRAQAKIEGCIMHYQALVNQDGGDVYGRSKLESWKSQCNSSYEGPKK